MKYLITDKNIKWDNNYSNTMYFENDTFRDEFVNKHLFNDENYDYKSNLENAIETNTNILSQEGGTIEIEWNGTIEDLFNKNTIILKESVLSTKPKFYFINDVMQTENNNIFILEIQTNIFLTYTGILENTNAMELMEGHINDASILDMVIDAGYRTMKSIQPLQRNFDWGGTFPNKDINTLNNQWIYCMIKTPNTNDAGKPLFRYNGQVQPYRVLVAPFNDIIIQSKESVSNTIAQVNERWDSVYYSINNVVVGGVKDEDIKGDTTSLDREVSVNIINNPNSAQGDVKISFTFNGVDRLVRIPYTIFNSRFKNLWDIIVVGNETQTNLDKEQELINNGGASSSSSFDNISALELKWDTLNNVIRLRAPKRDKTINTNKLNWFHRAYKKRTWGAFIPLGWETIYLQPTTNKTSGLISSTFKDLPIYPYWSETVEGFETLVGISTNEYEKFSWNCTIKNIYQGEETGDEKVWTKNELVKFINSQANPTTDEVAEIIDVKISSFNPLSFDANGAITNVKVKDAENIGWEELELIELFQLNSDEAELLNTYDLDNYLDKSWIQGMENYSIMIENNKEFTIKPEFIYSYKQFKHQIIPTPSEWTERLVWEGDIHNEGYEFVNDKEILFATNAFNEYQANNPGALKNQQFNNNLKSLKAVSELAIGVGTGGVGMVLGAEQVGSNIIDRYNYKQNIGIMKDKPVVSSGTGNAYGDVYFNKNAFGLSIVEWTYTTPQAESILDAVIRNGLSWARSIKVNYNAIKRPQFNYIKINNGKEVFMNKELSPNIVQQLSGIFNKGVRVWYDYTNYMNFDIDNGSYFRKDVINYIPWNTTK